MRSNHLARLYRGVAIFPARSSGIHWTANPGIGVTLRSDTLAGIKRLIRETMKGVGK